jgi:hypothetical protein
LHSISAVFLCNAPRVFMYNPTTPGSPVGAFPPRRYTWLAQSLAMRIRLSRDICGRAAHFSVRPTIRRANRARIEHRK